MSVVTSCAITGSLFAYVAFYTLYGSLLMYVTSCTLPSVHLASLPTVLTLGSC